MTKSILLCYFLNINQNIFINSSGAKRINNNQALWIDKHTLRGKATLKIIVRIRPVIQVKLVFLFPHKALNTSKTINDIGSAITKTIHKLGISLNNNGII